MPPQLVFLPQEGGRKGQSHPHRWTVSQPTSNQERRTHPDPGGELSALSHNSPKPPSSSTPRPRLSQWPSRVKNLICTVHPGRRTMTGCQEGRAPHCRSFSSQPTPSELSARTRGSPRGQRQTAHVKAPGRSTYGSNAILSECQCLAMALACKDTSKKKKNGLPTTQAAGT